MSEIDARPIHDLRSRRVATAVGAIAVLLWSMLAWITTGARGIPPFELTALAFAVAAVLGLALVAARGRAGLAKLRQRPAAWLLGVGGFFGFHFFYFVALANAPVVEASLIVYLWPLLIVLLAALLPGERLRWFHVAGGLLGLAGAALLVTRGGSIGFEAEHTLGYLAAAGGALAWSGYSVLNRFFSDVPTEAVAGYCGVTAVLAGLCHWMLETWVAPNPGHWMAIAALGIGPLGAAFFVWDYGTKRGNLQALGGLAYAAPLLSTLLLIAAGEGEPTWTVAVGCLLIVGGAVLAAGGLVQRRKRPARRSPSGREERAQNGPS